MPPSFKNVPLYWTREDYPIEGNILKIDRNKKDFRIFGLFIHSYSKYKLESNKTILNNVSIKLSVRYCTINDSVDSIKRTRYKNWETRIPERWWTPCTWNVPLHRNHPLPAIASSPIRAVSIDKKRSSAPEGKSAVNAFIGRNRGHCRGH